MRRSISILIIICCCGFLAAACKSSKKSARTGPPKSDVDFARDVFRMMAEGDMAVEEMIDWEHLSVAGMETGSTYKALNSEASRENYRKSFIKGYSSSFKSSGGSVDVLSNWREQSKDSSRTIVAADWPEGKSLLVTVSHADGQQSVSALEIR